MSRQSVSQLDFSSRAFLCVHDCLKLNCSLGFSCCGGGVKIGGEYRPSDMAAGAGIACFKYSCKSATETLEWIHAIIDFLKPFRFFLNSHVVNFFKDRMWESVDKEWMECLRKEPVETLVQIPCGVIQDHWPASLREFVLTSRSLSFPHDQENLQKAFPGLRVASLNKVLAQGMNQKKKHEVETLAAVIGSIARRIRANTIVDVGSGQGYLAQVLSFEHEFSVVAIDASSHHGSVTEARAKRIEKYYASKIHETRTFSKPQTVTCQVLSPAMLKAACNSILEVQSSVKPDFSKKEIEGQSLEGNIGNESLPCFTTNGKRSMVLAGLHACGDLSVTMLKTFVECDEVKALVSLGCCYNLLSEDWIPETEGQCGFPVSKSAKAARFHLGKSARDLACQSAERWRCLGEAAWLHNFELHLFRAAFQMVLDQYYPEIIKRSPTIGRQGKALRRSQNRRILESNANKCVVSCTKNAEGNENGSTGGANSLQVEHVFEEIDSERFCMFQKFCNSGLERLGLHDSHDDDVLVLWNEVAKSSDLVGPYWTLRTALGPVLETLVLLDRLLFLQEQDNIHEAVLIPLFDPVLSPRNVALIAEKAELTSSSRLNL